MAIFGIIGACSIIAFFVGLIAPSVFARKGKPAPSRAKVCGISVLVFFVIGGIQAAQHTSNTDSNQAQPIAVPKHATAGSTAAVADTPAYVPTPWAYGDQKDDMSGKNIHYAQANAVEMLYFKFPYSGGANPQLMLMKHPRFGTSVVLSISKGQFICGVEDCTVMVRFDDGKATRYTAQKPADYSSTQLFIVPASKFIAAAKKSKRVIVEAAFYQEGSRDMEFKTEQLKW